MVSQPAIASDKAAVPVVEQEWAERKIERPEALYVDGGYTSAELLAQAQEEGRDLRGPVASSPTLKGRHTVEDFVVDIASREARCPAGHLSRQCSRLEAEKTDASCKEMHRRNGVEGSISELKRGYGLNRSRYRSEAKNQLQAYLIGAACNLKRWSRRLLWEGRKGGSGGKSTLLGTVWGQLKALGTSFCRPSAISPLLPRRL